MVVLCYLAFLLGLVAQVGIDTWQKAHATATPTTVVTVTAPVSPTNRATPISTPVPPDKLMPDPGYYGLIWLQGAGPQTLPVIAVPVRFKFIWQCSPIYGPHWLRIAVYKITGNSKQEVSDIVNFTCDTPLTQAHGLAWYEPGVYRIVIMSHVRQPWKLLVEAPEQ